ncbi:MAG: UDP-N-acetylmuramoyl-tripeptide--D-alanyl-D-alanine ligase [Planctomycetota bacterium]
MIPFTVDEIAILLGASAPTDARGVAVRGLSTDSRSTAPGDLFVALDGPNFRGRDFVEAAFERGAVAAVATPAAAAGPGVAAGPVIDVADGHDALGTLGAAIRARLDVPVVAITGSVGKTTTKDATAALLASRLRVVAAPASFNNRIGVPLTLARAEARTEALVLELGTSLPGEIARLTALARPTLAVVTAVAASHLEGLGSIEGVLEEKLSIASGLVPGGVLLVNGDDSRLAARAEGLGARRYGLGEDCEIRAHDARWDAREVAFRLSPGGPVVRAPLAGRHNLSNLLAAAAIARELGLSEDEIAVAAPTLRGPRLRWQRETRPLRSGGEFELVLDCYNANPASMRAALETFAADASPRGRWLVLGDMAELGATAVEAHRELGRSLVDYPARGILFVGAAMAEAARSHLEAGGKGGVAVADRDGIGLALAELGAPAAGEAVLVKGSRSMALERAFETGGPSR